MTKRRPEGRFHFFLFGRPPLVKQRVEAELFIMNISELDEVVNSAAVAPSEEEKRYQTMVSTLNALSISVHDQIPADINTISIGGVDTFAREGIHFVKAKAKQGKTSMLSIVESVYISSSGQWGLLQRIGPQPLRVYHIDTEQKPYDTQCFKNRVLRLAGETEESVADRYGIYNMRGIIDNEMKKTLIEVVLKEKNPDVLVIDGVVDLINNFNEVDESKELIAWLMHLADEYKVVLFCVLHTNKNALDHNMRGHLGTMSEQKCDTTTECEKDEKTGLVVVKCANSRHRPYSDWSFTWDDDGNLVDAEEQRCEYTRKQAEALQLSREQKALELRTKRQNTMLSILEGHGGRIQRSELTQLLETAFGVSRKTVSPLITGWISDRIIYEIDNMIQTTSQGVLFEEE